MNSTVKQTLALHMVESLMPPKSNAKNKDNISKWMYVLRLIIHIIYGQYADSKVFRILWRFEHKRRWEDPSNCVRKHVNFNNTPKYIRDIRWIGPSSIRNSTYQLNWPVNWLRERDQSPGIYAVRVRACCSKKEEEKPSQTIQIARIQFDKNREGAR